jgi:hypothetical protein
MPFVTPSLPKALQEVRFLPPPNVAVGADAPATEAPATTAPAPTPSIPVAALTTAAPATPSFFSQHKKEIAVIGLALAIPFMLLALKGGSHDAEQRRQAALRAKYGKPQKERSRFEEDLLADLSRFESA